jgi:general secretion pathway protein F
VEAFRYEALDATGRTVSGTVQADNPRQARSQLRAQGLLPSALQPLRETERARQPWTRGLSSAELSLVTRQLATLFESGLTVEQSLTALAEESPEPKTRELLASVKAEISAGLSLSAAMRTFTKSFPEFYCALIHAGEESGALPQIMQRLADYLDARQALKQKIGLALLYPALVSVVAVLVVTGLLAYVVPQIVQVFQQSRETLPLLTRMLIALSGFFHAGWPYLVALVVAALIGFQLAMRRESSRRAVHAFLLRLPGVGTLLRGTDTSRFASTLAILAAGGVPLLTALRSSADAMANLAMRAPIEGVIDRVREGASVSRALRESRAFPPLLVHMVASGEASGKLSEMLERAARLQMQALERRLAVFLTVFEPAMILVMGGIVLMIVLAILLPIIEINQLVR